MWARIVAGALVLVCALPAYARETCSAGRVFEDRNGNARQDANEAGLSGIAVSNGREIVRSDARGDYRLPPRVGAKVFVIKPAGFSFALRADGLPDFWRDAGTNVAVSACAPIALRRLPAARASMSALRVLLFGDPQPKSSVDVGHYARDIVDRVIEDAAGASIADLGLTLGDVVDDDMALYPAMKRETARMRVPWLHVAGNHDMEPQAIDDESALAGFQAAFGPDTLAWEEPQASVIVLDDVIRRPGPRAGYIGGLREDQFAFLENYLRSARRDRLLVLAFHIPLFEPEGKDTFRDEDRTRLFALLKDFPKLLLLSAHNHTQQHVFHTAAGGWHGATPLHEYNVGATCGAFWSGTKDARGVPESTMADGTPKGWARLLVQADGGYVLRYHPAHAPHQALHLHAPKRLRRGAYPAWGVYANVYMGRADSRVEFRVDGGEWKPMRPVRQPDPRLLAENVRDDAAPVLRGYDRSPEAQPSAHLWRGALPTDLALGPHTVEVRVQDGWSGEQRASTTYALEDAEP